MNRIMVVDDDPLLVKFLRFTLEQSKYEVATFTSPEQALDVFQKNPEDFDLVITDVLMPKMTGDRMIAKMHEIRPDLKAIFTSGDLGDVRLPAEAIFLPKPVKPSDLQAAVQQILVQ